MNVLFEFQENSNLAFALRGKPEIGNVRETFVLNQLLNAGLDITSPEEGDFALEGLIIEAGGKTKNSSQVRHTENFMIAADDVETGEGNKVPVWLLGFLY